MNTGRRATFGRREAALAAGLTFCLAIAQASDDPRIEITDDGVTIRAEHTSIRSVLEELSRQTGLIVISRAALNEPISVEIEQRTLPQAVRRLLRHKSFMLQESERVAGGRLWIFATAARDEQFGWSARPAPRPGSAADRSSVDYQILAASSDASDREEAMFGFGDIADGNSNEYLLIGLSDPEESVREEAIQSLAELGGTESVVALGYALHDPVASVRVDAIDALGEIGGRRAIMLLRGALADENLAVRGAAAEWLTEIEQMQD